MSNPIALVIEDDINVCEFFEFTLESAGYAVQTAFDKKVGFEKLNQFEPNLVLLDFHLPDGNGKEILQFIRENHKLKDTFVIMATGELKAVDQKTHDLANMILTKPIEFGQLFAIAQRVLRARS